MAFAAAFLVSLVLAFALTPFADRLAWATGFLDRPAARKLHTSATALLGGPVVFVCALGGWGAARLLAPATFERDAITLLSGAFIALGLGRSSCSASRPRSARSSHRARFRTSGFRRRSRARC